MLLALAGLLLVIRWRRRRAAPSLGPETSDGVTADIAVYLATHVPAEEPVPATAEQRPPVEVGPSAGRVTASSRPAPSERRPVPQPRGRPAGQGSAAGADRPACTGRRERWDRSGLPSRADSAVEVGSGPDGRDVRDEPPVKTRMAVATRQANGHGETSQSADVAELSIVEEPVVVAEETPQMTDQTDETGEPAAEQPADSAAQPAVEEPSEVEAVAAEEEEAEPGTDATPVVEAAADGAKTSSASGQP